MDASVAAAYRNAKADEMRRWLTIILLLVWSGVAWGQSSPPMCAITGSVANPDGSPYVGVIKFDSSIVQIINNIPINPLQVSTATSPSGVINPISLPQGAWFKVTICPNASSASGCAATFTAIVPASASANFGNMAMGVNLTPSIVASSLSVSGVTSLASTTINSNPFTVGSGTQSADLTAGGTNVFLGPTQLTSFVGLTTKGPQIQLIGPSSSVAETAIGSILWGSPANAVGTPVTPVGGSSTSFARVSAYINGTAGGGAQQPSGGLQFGTSLGDGTTAQTRMEVLRDGTLTLPYFAAAGSFSGGPGTINVSKGYYINGASQFQSGSFTPILTCAGGPPTINTNTTVGNWWTAGDTVFYYIQAFWSTVSGGSGGAQVAGLPFPAVGGGSGQGGFLQQVVDTNSTSSLPGSFPGGQNRLEGTIFNGNTFVGLYEGATFGGDFLYPVPCANAFANTPSGIFITGWYKFQ